MVEPGPHGVSRITPWRNDLGSGLLTSLYSSICIVIKVRGGTGDSIIVILIIILTPDDLDTGEVTGVTVIDVILRSWGAIGDGGGIQLTLTIGGEVITLNLREGCGCGNSDWRFLTSKSRPLPLFVDTSSVLSSTPSPE